MKLRVLRTTGVSALVAAMALFWVSTAGAHSTLVPPIKPVNLAGTVITASYKHGPDAPNVFRQDYVSNHSLVIEAVSGPALEAGFKPTMVRYRAVRVAPKMLLVGWIFPKSFKFGPAAHEQIVYDLAKDLIWNMNSSADPQGLPSVGAITVATRHSSM